MKNILILAFACFLASNIQSQTNAVDIKDPKAKKILDDISSQFSSFKTLEMEFDLEIAFVGQSAEVQSGKLIQAGDKFFVDMPAQTIYCNGASLWIHLKNNKEVQLNNAEAAAEGGFLDPSSLLNIYKTGDYAYAVTNESKEDDLSIQQIEFKPLDSDSPYTKLRMTVVKNKNEVRRMKVFGKDGSNYTLVIKNISSNKLYPPETFNFDQSKFPGVHVEDLRID